MTLTEAIVVGIGAGLGFALVYMPTTITLTALTEWRAARLAARAQKQFRATMTGEIKRTREALRSALMPHSVVGRTPPEDQN